MRDFKSRGLRITLSALFIVGALIVMPVAEQLRRGGRTVAEVSLSEGFDMFFKSPDFDGIQSINNAVVFVNQHGPQHGRQLLSTALFFVPRTVWPNKSESSGALAARSAQMNFFNVSQPLPGEFYMDFGLVGAVIGGFIWGLLLCAVDGWVDRNWRRRLGSRLTAGLIVGFSIIVYRGALLAVISPIAVIAVEGLFVVLIGFKNDRRGLAGRDANHGRAEAIIAVRRPVALSGTERS